MRSPKCGQKRPRRGSAMWTLIVTEMSSMARDEIIRSSQPRAEKLFPASSGTRTSSPDRGLLTGRLLGLASLMDKG